MTVSNRKFCWAKIKEAVNSLWNTLQSPFLPLLPQGPPTSPQKVHAEASYSADCLATKFRPGKCSIPEMPLHLRYFKILWVMCMSEAPGFQTLRKGTDFTSRLGPASLSFPASMMAPASEAVCIFNCAIYLLSAFPNPFLMFLPSAFYNLAAIPWRGCQ